MTTNRFEIANLPVVAKLTELRTAKESPSGKLRQIMKTKGDAAEAWLDLPAADYLNAAMASGWIGTQGADIPDNADNADIAVLLRATAASHSLDYWAMGDVINFVRTHKFDGRLPKPEAEKIAAIAGVSYKTCINRAAVAAAFPKDKRLPEVPSGVHAVLAGIEDDKLRFALLTEAAANGWTVVDATEKSRDFLAMGATANEDGTINTPDIAVLPASSGETVVQTNVSASSTGLAANVDACIATMIEDMVSDGLTAANIQAVLKKYAAAGMLKFPARAWLAEATKHVVATEPVVKTNGKKVAHVASEVVFANDEDEAAVEVAFA